MADTTCWVAPRHIATTQRLRGYQSNNASLVSECWSFRMLHLDSQFALYFAIFQVAGLSYGSFHSVGLRAARRVPLRRTAAAVVSRPDRRCSPHAPLRFTYESLSGTFLATPRAERALVIGWQEWHHNSARFLMLCCRCHGLE